MDSHFWAMCAFANVMSLMCGLIFADGQLVVISVAMLVYSVYQFGKTIGEW